MPKLWNETIEEHRHAVREATLDTTAALVAEHGLAAVTMSRIAEQTGIGRATLYKYFADVEAILVAWHERQVSAHLEHLSAVRDEHDGAAEQLDAVLEAFALLRHSHPHTDIAAMLHRREHVARAERRLGDLVEDLLVRGVEAADLRSDVPAEELAAYCLHALGAAGDLPSREAVRRLVGVTAAALRPPP